MEPHPDARYVTGFVSRKPRSNKRQKDDEDYCPNTSGEYTSSSYQSVADSIFTPSDEPTDPDLNKEQSSSKKQRNTKFKQSNSTPQASKIKAHALDLLDEDQESDDQDAAAFTDEISLHFVPTDATTEAMLLREYPSLAFLYTVIQQEKASRSIKENVKNSVANAMQSFHDGKYIDAINIIKECIAGDARAHAAFEMLASFYETIIRERLYLQHTDLAKVLHVYGKPQSVAENILLTASLEFQLAGAIFQPKAERFLTLTTDFLKIRRLSKALYCLHKLLPLFVNGLDDLYYNNILERDTQILIFERDMCNIFERFMTENPNEVTLRDHGVLLSFNRKVCTLLMHAPYVETHTLEFLDKVTTLKLGTLHRSYRVGEQIALLIDQQLRLLEISGFLPGVIDRLMDLMYRTRRYESLVQLLNTFLEFALKRIEDKDAVSEQVQYKRYICLFSIHKAKVDVIITLQSIVSALRAAPPDTVLGSMTVQRMNKVSLLHIKNVLITFYTPAYHSQYNEALEEVSAFLLEGLTDILWLIRTHNMGLINDLIVNADANKRLSKKLISDTIPPTPEGSVKESNGSNLTVTSTLDKFSSQFDTYLINLLPKTIATYINLLQAQENTSLRHKRTISRLSIASSRIQALFGKSEAELAKQLGNAFTYYKGVEPRKELARFLYAQQTDNQLAILETSDQKARKKLDDKLLRNMKLLLDLVRPKISLMTSSEVNNHPQEVLLQIPLISYPRDYRISFSEQFRVAVKPEAALNTQDELDQEINCIVATYCATSLQIYALVSLFSFYVSTHNSVKGSSDTALSVETFLETCCSNFSLVNGHSDLDTLARITFLVGFGLLFTDAYLLPANYPRPRYTYKLLAILKTFQEANTSAHNSEVVNAAISRYLSCHPLKIFRNSILLTLINDIESCRWEFDLLLSGLVANNMRSYIVPSEAISRTDFYLFLVELEHALGKSLEKEGLHREIFYRSSILLSLLFFIIERSPKEGTSAMHQNRLDRMHLLAKDLIQKTGIVSMQYSYQRNRCFSNPNNMQDYTILIRQYQQADPTLPIGKFLKRILRRSPDSVPAMFAMAATFFQSSYLREATELYEKLCPLCFSDDIFYILGIDRSDICNLDHDKRILIQRSIQASVCYTLAIAYLHLSGNKRIQLKSRHIAMGLRYMQLFAVCNGENKKITYIAIALVLMYYCYRLDAAEIMLQRVLRSNYGPYVSGNISLHSMHLLSLPRMSSNVLLDATTSIDSSKNCFFERHLKQKPPPREPYTIEDERSTTWAAAHALSLIYLTVGSTESANYIISRYLTFSSASSIPL